MPKRYTITAALPYANGALHLGHLAGAYLPADVYARFLRLQGKEVAFVCGSDEHGAAITIRAKKEGLSPRDIIDKYHQLNKNTFERLGISFDVYDRTSSPLHHETAQAFFSRLIDKGGELEVQSSEQYYDAEYEQFLADRYIVGTCPKCGHEEAYGDQCEKCGATLSPAELINPRSTLSHKTPELRETKHWYFRLDKHSAWLKTWINEGLLDGEMHHDPEHWRAHVKGQCRSWLEEEDLRPRAISRDLDWGVPVPLPEAQGKVLYVWFDAPIGYISATRQWAKDQGKNWEDYWKSPDTELVHFIGKDNIVFHCIVFPAMLKAHGDYILPKNVPANQFLNLEGRKFSKSKGWVIEQHQYLEDFEGFPNKEDALRFALLRTLPENKDGDFKWDEFVSLYDGELVDVLGNYLHRAISLTHKYFEGILPEVQAEDEDRALMLKVNELVGQVQQFILDYRFREALQAVLSIARLGNEYLQTQAPWTVAKTEPHSPRIAASIYHSVLVAEALSLALHPFLPFAAEKLRAMLNLPAIQAGQWANLAARDYALGTGSRLNAAEVLFAKIQDRKNETYLRMVEVQKARFAELAKAFEAAEAEAKAQAEQAAKPAFEPEKPSIEFEDFGKLDIRTGRILQAERVPKADKLLHLQVDLGYEQRSIVSGIAAHYAPEDLIGQEVLVLANLAPRKLRGVLSQGMVLMTEDAEGKLVFVQPKNSVGQGRTVR